MHFLVFPHTFLRASILPGNNPLDTRFMIPEEAAIKILGTHIFHDYIAYKFNTWSLALANLSLQNLALMPQQIHPMFWLYQGTHSLKSSPRTALPQAPPDLWGWENLSPLLGSYTTHLHLCGLLQIWRKPNSIFVKRFISNLQVWQNLTSLNFRTG